MQELSRRRTVSSASTTSTNTLAIIEPSQDHHAQSSESISFCSCGDPLKECTMWNAGQAFCSTRCIKAHHRRRRAQHGCDDWPSSQPLNGHLSTLSLEAYYGQSLFHHIDTTWPGLQLVHAKPYIFVVRDFLSATECELLMTKAAGAAAIGEQQLVGESSATHRTSTGVVARNEEVPRLRERIAALTRIDTVDKLQPLKISRYEVGQLFAEHCDAVDGAGPSCEANDYYADAARVENGTRHVPQPGANRFITVFVYLNDCSAGGRTRFRWLDAVPHFYDAPCPAPMGVTSTCTGAAGEVSIRPERGMAVVHFPSCVPAAGGFTDRNASHESEAAVDTKWVCQQFVWSHAVPRDALEGTREPLKPLSAVTF